MSNANVNVYVYSLISHRVQHTSQFTPLVFELSLVRSHLLWREFSAFSAAIAIHNSPLFVPPGTHHCWVDRGGMIWKACPTPLHMAGSVTRAVVTHPSTNQVRLCLTSVIWRELVTTRPCATMSTCIWAWKALAVEGFHNLSARFCISTNLFSNHQIIITFQLKFK